MGHIVDKSFLRAELARIMREISEYEVEIDDHRVYQFFDTDYVADNTVYARLVKSDKYEYVEITTRSGLRIEIEIFRDKRHYSMSIYTATDCS